MPPTKYSFLSSISFAFGLLPTLVNSYDCSQLTQQKKCGPSYKGNRSDFPACLVSQFGVSAFIQCASQESAPEFAGTDGHGELTSDPALEVLTTALSNNRACDACPLANKIRTVNMGTSPSPDFQSFGPRLCAQVPADQGMCCLKQCLGGSPERSIQAYCAGNVNDLMQAQPLPESCISNRVSGDSSSSGADSVSSGDDPSTVYSSGGGDVSVVETLSPSSQLTQVSTTPTTLPAVNDAATTSTASTRTLPTPQTTPSTGAASRRLVTFQDSLKRLGIVAVLPFLVAV